MRRGFATRSSNRFWWLTCSGSSCCIWRKIQGVGLVANQFQDGGVSKPLAQGLDTRREIQIMDHGEIGDIWKVLAHALCRVLTQRENLQVEQVLPCGHPQDGIFDRCGHGVFQQLLHGRFVRAQEIHPWPWFEPAEQGDIVAEDCSLDGSHVPVVNAERMHHER
jgi:hypothetical protein